MGDLYSEMLFEVINLFFELQFSIYKRDKLLIFVQDVEHYNKLEDPTDEENDMLDLAFGLSETWVNHSWTYDLKCSFSVFTTLKFDID